MLNPAGFTIINYGLVQIGINFALNSPGAVQAIGQGLGFGGFGGFGSSYLFAL